MKLKHKDIATYRSTMLAEQRNLCALCGDFIVDDAVLDHDHSTGRLRRVLHRGCNSVLGKLENAMPMNKITMIRLRGIADNLVKYLEQEYEDIVHPTYLTKEERAMKKKKTKKPGKRGY